MSGDYEHLLGAHYDKLYAKYLDNPRRLLVAPDPPVVLGKETRMLDLCSGSGAVVKAAIEMGVDPGRILVVEESKAMTLDMPGEVRMLHEPVTRRLTFDKIEHIRRSPFDLITCRQAVNYWWHPEIVARVASLLAEDGCFVFNTFNTAPAEVPQTKQYVHDGAQFAEIAYRIGDVVHHVQAREGMPMHLTTFLWIDPAQYADDLDSLTSRGFLARWDRTSEGTTDTYVCRR